MIDPKFINSVDLFNEVVNKYPLAERLEIGSPIQYYFDHSPEDRIKQLQRLTGYSADVVEFLLKTGVATSFDKYENMRNEIPDEVCCNPFMFTHVLSEDFSVENIKYFPKLLDYIPTTNELIEGKYSKIQLLTLGSSVKRMFLVYALFNSLKMDTDCFKFYKHSPDLEESLNSLGHSSKAILKVIIKQSREKYGTEGFLGEILDIKYLNNCLNPNKAIRMILGQIRNVKKMDISLDTIWSVLADGCSIEGVYGYGGLSCLFKFYLYRYKRWSNHSDVVIMDDGSEFYSHRHSMLNSYSRHIGKDGSDCPANVRLPTSINTSPNELFRDFIERYAKSEYLNIITEYGIFEFKDMNDKFQHLDSSKYKYLDNPVALIIEGRNMSHCVGGEDYISECAVGHTYILHYTDGSRHGYTIELNRNVLHKNSGHSLFFSSFDENSDWWEGYTVSQIKGYNNDEPSQQTTLDILTDLIHASIKFTGVPEDEVKKEFHKYRMSMKGRQSTLRDHTTIYYRPMMAEDGFIPFKDYNAKDVNHQLLNPRTIYQYGKGHSFSVQEMSEGEYERRMGQLGPRGLAGDFQGDMLLMHNQMHQMHPRNPELGYYHGANLDITEMYPTQQTVLSAKHMLGHSEFKMAANLNSVDKIPLLRLIKPTWENTNINPDLYGWGGFGDKIPDLPFRNLTGREYLIGQLLHSINTLYGSWWNDGGKMSINIKLGLQLLINKVRYGFMSEAELVKTIFLVSGHGYNLFCSEVSVLADMKMGTIRKNWSSMSVGGKLYSVTSERKPFIPSMALYHSDCEVLFDLSHSTEMWHKFNGIVKKTNAVGFDYNDSFTRNIFGRYGVNFN